MKPPVTVEAKVAEELRNWLASELEQLDASNTNQFAHHVVTILLHEDLDIEDEPLTTGDDFLHDIYSIKKGKTREKQKKAAVQFLRSAVCCDDPGEAEIQGVIDELMVKIEETKNKMNNKKGSKRSLLAPIAINVETSSNHTCVKSDSSEEERRYNEAFPSLPGEDSPSKEGQTTLNYNSVWNRSPSSGKENFKKKVKKKAFPSTPDKHTSYFSCQAEAQACSVARQVAASALAETSLPSAEATEIISSYSSSSSFNNSPGCWKSAFQTVNLTKFFIPNRAPLKLACPMSINPISAPTVFTPVIISNYPETDTHSLESEATIFRNIHTYSYQKLFYPIKDKPKLRERALSESDNEVNNIFQNSNKLKGKAFVEKFKVGLNGNERTEVWTTEIDEVTSFPAHFGKYWQNLVCKGTVVLYPQICSGDLALEQERDKDMTVPELTKSTICNSTAVEIAAQVLPRDSLHHNKVLEEQRLGSGPLQLVNSLPSDDILCMDKCNAAEDLCLNDKLVKGRKIVAEMVLETPAEDKHTDVPVLIESSFPDKDIPMTILVRPENYQQSEGFGGGRQETDGLKQTTACLFSEMSLVSEKFDEDHTGTKTKVHVIPQQPDSFPSKERNFFGLVKNAASCHLKADQEAATVTCIENHLTKAQISDLNFVNDDVSGAQISLDAKASFDATAFALNDWLSEHTCVCDSTYFELHDNYKLNTSHDDGPADAGVKDSCVRLVCLQARNQEETEISVVVKEKQETLDVSNHFAVSTEARKNGQMTVSNVVSTLMEESCDSMGIYNESKNVEAVDDDLTVIKAMAQNAEACYWETTEHLVGFGQEKTTDDERMKNKTWVSEAICGHLAVSSETRSPLVDMDSNVPTDIGSPKSVWQMGYFIDLTENAKDCSSLDMRRNIDGLAMGGQDCNIYSESAEGKYVSPGTSNVNQIIRRSLVDKDLSSNNHRYKEGDNKKDAVAQNYVDSPPIVLEQLHWESPFTTNHWDTISRDILMSFRNRKNPLKMLANLQNVFIHPEHTSSMSHEQHQLLQRVFINSIFSTTSLEPFILQRVRSQVTLFNLQIKNIDLELKLASHIPYGHFPKCIHVIEGNILAVDCSDLEQYWCQNSANDAYETALQEQELVKGRTCCNWLENNCTLGNQCPFSHPSI